jgi:IS4 transposase
MAFAQLIYRESLRDIETCLRAISRKLYHAGFRGSIARSTLAKANERRDWRIYADLAQVLIAHARRLYAADGFGVELEQTAYALDSTAIDLCLALFPWARFRRRKGAVKLHTFLDLRGNIPCFVRITHGKTHDVTALDALPIEAGAFYVMDRGYLDFGRLYRFTLGLAFFVIRGKKNLDYSRRSYRRVDKTTGLRSDQTIVLNGPKTSKAYPEPLRRVAYCDPETKKRFVFLTNNFQLPALTIAQIYKSRWQIELFFRWIKQHLRIKSFYGTSPNAVRTQVWIAVGVYVLVAIVRQELKLERSMGEILQILSISLFEKTPIAEALSLPKPGFGETTSHNQLPLFDF